MADRYPLRVYEGRVEYPLESPPSGDYVIHAASIVSNMEYAGTPCHRSFGGGQIFEAPRGSLVTCIQCYVFGWRD